MTEKALAWIAAKQSKNLTGDARVRFLTTLRDQSDKIEELLEADIDRIAISASFATNTVCQFAFNGSTSKEIVTYFKQFFASEMANLT